MYGTQTMVNFLGDGYMFENDVKMYGTQTEISEFKDNDGFENDVKMYGTQTFQYKSF